MPILAKRLTSSAPGTLPLPATGYVVHWCPETAGLGVRVSATGDRAYVAQRRLDGKTVRRTLGKAAGPGAISADSARRLQITTSSALQEGADPLERKREQRKADKVEAVTFEKALRDYVKGKRRAKDKKPLKQRTIDDYLAMIDGPTATKQAGELHSIAKRPVFKLTADELRRLHGSLVPRGERRQTYAMQVVRAVLRHFGVAIAGNPLSPMTAGVERIQLAPSRGDPSPIPPEKVRSWWRAAGALASDSADMLKFMLLTGARPGEAAGLLVGNVDLAGGRAVLKDTKNRRDHVLVLPSQAVELLRAHCKGKRVHSPVFGIADAGKTMAAINEAAGTPGVTPHKLRHTFASIADDLVSAATARAMLNHAIGDVAQVHYIGISDAKLRAGWQAVADFVSQLDNKQSDRRASRTNPIRIKPVQRDPTLRQR
jgi:integrase